MQIRPLVGLACPTRSNYSAVFHALLYYSHSYSVILGKRKCLEALCKAWNPPCKYLYLLELFFSCFNSHVGHFHLVLSSFKSESNVFKARKNNFSRTTKTLTVLELLSNVSLNSPHLCILGAKYLEWLRKQMKSSQW